MSDDRNEMKTMTIKDIFKHPIMTTNSDKFRIVTLDTVKDDTDASHRMYELVREGVLDTPGHSGGFEAYDEFMENVYHRAYLSKCQTQFLAIHADEWIGLSSLTIEPDGVSASFGLTTVRRDYRRQGIARAIKQHALRYCKTHGVRTVTTQVHPDNQPMTSLNRQLGFSIE